MPLTFTLQCAPDKERFRRNNVFGPNIAHLVFCAVKLRCNWPSTVAIMKLISHIMCHLIMINHSFRTIRNNTISIAHVGSTLVPCQVELHLAFFIRKSAPWACLPCIHETPLDYLSALSFEIGSMSQLAMHTWTTFDVFHYQIKSASRFVMHAGSRTLDLFHYQMRSISQHLMHTWSKTQRHLSRSA